MVMPGVQELKVMALWPNGYGVGLTLLRDRPLSEGGGRPQITKDCRFESCQGRYRKLRHCRTKQLQLGKVTTAWPMTLKLEMTAVGFEPTQLALVELESTP